jgi:endonuclease/exonuclease/phosphatase family metal-dependent hydrolase
LSANGSKLFSRDCPEYDVRLPSQHRITILPNHLKSKRNGDDQASRERRLAQATKAHEYALNALDRSSYVLVAGDMNDTPVSAAIQPLLQGDFADVITHPDYPTDRPGTYTTGLANEKIDYLIMSPALRARLKTTGIERRGTYHPRLWPSFDTVTKTAEEASDHHLVWADFDL